MISRRWLFGVIVAVPLIGFAAAQGLRAYSNSELRAAVQKQYPDADPARVSEITIDQLCDGSEPGLAETCSTYSNLGLMRAVAIGAGGLGIALLLVIRIAGSVARASRPVLLNTFRPGLYVTALTVIGLIAIHGIVAMAALWYAESMLAGRVHVGIILGIGLGALAGIAAVARNTFSLVRPAETVVIGRRIDRKQGRKLYERVEQLAKSLGALRPQHIVVGLDANFFVTEAKVTCLSGQLSGRTLYCSLPLSRIMSLPEFDAVIGHELGHFKGADTQFNQKFYPIYKGTAESLASLQAAGSEGARVVALLPAIGILTYFYEAFAVAESEHGRARELAADGEGASVTNTIAMSSALVKVHAFAGLWQPIQEAAVDALKGGQSFINVSKTFAEFIGRNATTDAVKGIGNTHSTHPTDSHPPLDVRLKSLGVTLSSVTQCALDVTPNEAAISLIDEVEKIEEEVSDAYQAFLARQLGINLEDAAPDAESTGAV